VKILQVLPSLEIGGGEVFTVALSEELLSRGHELELLCIRAGGELASRLSPALAERTTVLGKRFRFDASVWPRIASRMLQQRPDVVHTHLFTSLAWAGTASLATAIPAWVHTQHGCHDDDHGYLPAIRRALYPRIDAAVAVSEAVQQDLIDRRYLAKRTRTILNGINLSGRPTRVPQPGPLRLIAVGRLVPIKGHRYLLEALALARAAGLDAQLTLCGDGELRTELQQLAADLGIRDHVVFAGAVSDIPDRLAQADLFCMPSLSEGLPISALEAGAAALPMLVTDGGGAGALIEDGAGGRIVPSGNAQALADALLAFANDDLTALGAKSRATIEARYSIQATADAYELLFREILS